MKPWPSGSRRDRAAENASSHFSHENPSPGLIGALGTTLGDAGINIATFHLGRANQGGDAIALIEIDEEPDRDVIQKILGLEHVLQAVALRF